MFPFNVKELYQGISFDELTFKCIYCQKTYQCCESPEEVIFLHNKYDACECDVNVMNNQAYECYLTYRKIHNRIKTFNPFFFPDFKSILDLADEGFIFHGLLLK